MDLPSFKYHPDPLATESVETSPATCKCCGLQRGYVYAGPAYAIADLSEFRFCPWCIADGSAHERFDCSFTDPDCILGPYNPTALPRPVIEELAFRTPSFIGWQSKHWVACCGDAAAFVGHAGMLELKRHWPDAIPSIRLDSGLDEKDWAGYFSSLDKDGTPTAYVFRCLHCGKHQGYSDCD